MRRLQLLEMVDSILSNDDFGQGMQTSSRTYEGGEESTSTSRLERSQDLDYSQDQVRRDVRTHATLGFQEEAYHEGEVVSTRVPPHMDVERNQREQVLEPGHIRVVNKNNGVLSRLLYNVVAFTDEEDGIEKAGLITEVLEPTSRLEITVVRVENGQVKTEFYGTNWPDAHKLLRDPETNSRPNLVFDPDTGGPHADLANPITKPVGSEHDIIHKKSRRCFRGRTCKYAKKKKCKYEHGGRMIKNRFTLQS